MTLFLVVNDGGTSVFDPILVNRWGNFYPESGGIWSVFYCCFLMSVFEKSLSEINIGEQKIYIFIEDYA